MKTIKVESFPASYGESFLITLIGERTTNILIDMGLKDTYNKYIRKRLVELNNKNEGIDLLVFTHIDDDHISGGIKFFEENICNEISKMISVQNVWHNSYTHISKLDSDGYSHLKKCDVKDTNELTTRKNSLVSDITPQSATYLSDLILKGAYKWNINDLPICIDTTAQHQINDEVKIRVLTPSSTILKELKTEWEQKFLEDKFRNIRDKRIYEKDRNVCFELSIIESHIKEELNESKRNLITDISTGYKDKLTDYIENINEKTSLINQTSITFVLEFYGKKLLFMGDAPSATVAKELKNIYTKDDIIELDLVKLPHHGSKHNISDEFLKLTKCNRYLVATNGVKHSHPDMHTLAKIVSLQDTTENKVFYINYLSNRNIKTFDKEKWKNLFKYELKAENIEIEI
jgi:beta-lactamase superfamily II metal-dependent hydrolase